MQKMRPREQLFVTIFKTTISEVTKRADVSFGRRGRLGVYFIFDKFVKTVIRFSFSKAVLEWLSTLKPKICVVHQPAVAGVHPQPTSQPKRRPIQLITTEFQYINYNIRSNGLALFFRGHRRRRERSKNESPPHILFALFPPRPSAVMFLLA
jgi:hypothetical protein